MVESSFLTYFRRGQEISKESGSESAKIVLTELIHTDLHVSKGVAQGLALDVLSGNDTSFAKFEDTNTTSLQQKMLEARTEMTQKQLMIIPGMKLLAKAEHELVIYGPASVVIKDKEDEIITGPSLKEALPQLFKRGRFSLQHLDILVGEILPSFKDDKDNVTESTVRAVTKADIEQFPKLKEAKVKEGDQALFVVGKVWGDTKFCEEVQDQINKGELSSFSVSGQAVAETPKVHCEGYSCKLVNEITKIDLSAVTLCRQGMNPGAGFVVINKLGMDTLMKAAKCPLDCMCKMCGPAKHKKKAPVVYQGRAEKVLNQILHPDPIVKTLAGILKNGDMWEYYKDHPEELEEKKKVKKAEWVPHTGKRGGQGARNIRTGDIVYGQAAQALLQGGGGGRGAITSFSETQSGVTPDPITSGAQRSGRGLPGVQGGTTTEEYLADPNKTGAGQTVDEQVGDQSTSFEYGPQPHHAVGAAAQTLQQMLDEKGMSVNDLDPQDLKNEFDAALQEIGMNPEDMDREQYMSLLQYTQQHLVDAGPQNADDLYEGGPPEEWRDPGGQPPKGTDPESEEFWGGPGTPLSDQQEDYDRFGGDEETAPPVEDPLSEEKEQALRDEEDMLVDHEGPGGISGETREGPGPVPEEEPYVLDETQDELDEEDYALGGAGLGAGVEEEGDELELEAIGPQIAGEPSAEEPFDPQAARSEEPGEQHLMDQEPPLDAAGQPAQEPAEMPGAREEGTFTPAQPGDTDDPRNYFSDSFYNQFPDIDVVREDPYLAGVARDSMDELKGVGLQMGLQEDDIVDVLANVVDAMGSLGPGKEPEVYGETFETLMNDFLIEFGADIDPRQRRGYRRMVTAGKKIIAQNAQDRAARENMTKASPEETLNRILKARMPPEESQEKGLAIGYPQKPSHALPAYMNPSSQASTKKPRKDRIYYNHPAGSDRGQDSVNEESSRGTQPRGVFEKQMSMLESIIKAPPMIPKPKIPKVPKQGGAGGISPRGPHPEPMVGGAGPKAGQTKLGFGQQQAKPKPEGFAGQAAGAAGGTAAQVGQTAIGAGSPTTASGAGAQQGASQMLGALTRRKGEVKQKVIGALVGGSLAGGMGQAAQGSMPGGGEEQKKMPKEEPIVPEEERVQKPNTVKAAHAYHNPKMERLLEHLEGQGHDAESSHRIAYSTLGDKANKMFRVNYNRHCSMCFKIIRDYEDPDTYFYVVHKALVTGVIYEGYLEDLDYRTFQKEYPMYQDAFKLLASEDKDEDPESEEEKEEIEQVVA